ncbi:MAG: alpha-amylase family glycosyl hydrolase [Paludibacteraceae bacterium]|nr:alpha-amylase family glycosyl hydrolase [Paludibacteraceae bacterium]
MRNKLLFLSLLLCSAMWAAPKITRVEPLCWWTDMHQPLTLMFYGEDLQDATVSIQEVAAGRIMRGQCLGLVATAQHNAESKNYLFVDMDVRQEGTYRITLKKGNRRATYDYTVYPRREGSRERQSFTSADVIYLIMSDRFVDGDTNNNSTPDTREKADKTNVHGRFGGDIQGIISQLGHISDLGATAIWPTPLLLDNEEAWSYHGYACSDYYHIDPRYGSNQLYCQMVDSAHAHNIKVLMDMVPNHCGGAHWWMKDLPYHDWINRFDEFTRTNNVFSANYDINASEYDRLLSNRGWFDHPMPDMNLENPDLLRYFQQWAIWWIEYANLDGLRVDTYPYIEKIPASLWLKAIREEYPNINIVGECWTRPASAVAYWQSGANNRDGFDSNLPSVMDFPLDEAIRQALGSDDNGWGGGLTRVYDALAQDYLYGDVNNLLIFLDNHDMDRIGDVVKDKDPRRTKLAYALLSTMRGIPQVFAGDEYDMHSADMSLGHSTLRMPLPSEEQLTEEQRDMFDYQKHLLQWRKSEHVIHTGKTMHFLSRDNTYAFFRYNADEAVFVFANASEEARTIPTAHYAEILNRYNAVGTDILTGETVDLSRTDLQAAPLSCLIVKLKK